MIVKYPTVKEKTGLELAKQFLSSSWRSLEPDEVTWSGSGERLVLSSIEEAATRVSQMLDDLRSDGGSTDRDLLEGGATVPIHSALRDVDVVTLDDPGFWQYLALQHFWDFTCWREDEAFASGDPVKYLRYVDGAHPTECVVRRTFLRGQAVGGEDGYPLASIEKATDFWRSHVIRVSLGSSPTLTQAFASSHREDRLAWEELRQVARRLNRQVTNVVLPMVDADEASNMVSRARRDR